jgi:hypothetical protein
VTRRADFCQPWQWQMMICMTIELSKLLLSILRIEYKTLPVRRLGHKWAGKQSRLVSNVATSAVPDVDKRMKSNA